MMAAMKAGFAYACALLCFVTSVALSAPALADDADLRKQVEQGNSAFMASFNSMDVSGLAAIYATGAIVVDAAGARTDIAQYFEDNFKTGLHRAAVLASLSQPEADLALAAARPGAPGPCSLI